MTKERARYILDHRQMGGSLRFAFSGKYGSMGGETFEDGITEAEAKDIRETWETMDGNTSYTDAIIKIAKGNH